LKGRTENNGNPIYSSERAPGLILATGNEGLYLAQKTQQVSTYLSNDGGHSWFKVKLAFKTSDFKQLSHLRNRRPWRNHSGCQR